MSTQRDIDAGAAVLALAIIAVVAWALYKAYQGTSSSLAEIAKQILAFIAKAGAQALNAVYRMQDGLEGNVGSSFGYGVDQVKTGLTSAQADEIMQNLADYPDAATLGGQ